MKRSDLLILFINDQMVSKKQIGEFFKLVEKEYYDEVFSEQMTRSELPQWQDGKYGEWSMDINNDIKMLLDMSIIRVNKKANAMRTFTYDVYSLTEYGIDKRWKVIADAGDWIVEAVYQIKERLERKRT